MGWGSGAFIDPSVAGQFAGGNLGDEAQLKKMLEVYNKSRGGNFLETGLGLLTGSTGTALMGDALGGVGTILGNQLMKGVFGSGSSQANSAATAAADAAQKGIDVVAQNKSSLLQNTNSAGQQGPMAAMAAQRALNGQMVSGQATASMNRLNNLGDSQTSNAMSVAQNALKQSQLNMSGMKDMVRNMAAGSSSAKLGNLGDLAQSSAQSNMNALNQGTQALNNAGQTAGGMYAQANQIRNADLQSNFDRNVAPYLNKFENFQSLASNIAGPMASNASAISNSADTASYNLLGGTAQKYGTDAGSQLGYENYMNQALPMNLVSSLFGKTG